SVCSTRSNSEWQRWIARNATSSWSRLESAPSSAIADAHPRNGPSNRGVCARTATVGIGPRGGRSTSSSRLAVSGSPSPLAGMPTRYADALLPEDDGDTVGAAVLETDDASGRCVGVEAEMGKPVEHRVHRDEHLRAGDVHPETHVRS